MTSLRSVYAQKTRSVRSGGDGRRKNLRYLQLSGLRRRVPASQPCVHVTGGRAGWLAGWLVGVRRVRGKRGRRMKKDQHPLQAATIENHQPLLAAAATRPRGVDYPVDRRSPVADRPSPVSRLTSPVVCCLSPVTRREVAKRTGSQQRVRLRMVPVLPT